jgi:hypothetical protein
MTASATPTTSETTRIVSVETMEVSAQAVITVAPSANTGGVTGGLIDGIALLAGVFVLLAAGLLTVHLRVRQ